jgi:hypothetical protein
MSDDRKHGVGGIGRAVVRTVWIRPLGKIGIRDGDAYRLSGRSLRSDDRSES